MSASQTQSRLGTRAPLLPSVLPMFTPSPAPASQSPALGLASGQLTNETTGKETFVVLVAWKGWGQDICEREFNFLQ